VTASAAGSKPPLKRARYVLHICSVAGREMKSGRERDQRFPVLDLALIRLLDHVLDLFDNEPRFQHFTLDGETLPLEDYLAVRPENFERIEQAVQDGQLLIGPFYVQTHEDLFDTESLIRNLMIGTRTARVFGKPMMVGYLPHLTELPPQLPQIFKSFGIKTAVIGYEPGKPLVEQVRGIDGTVMLVSRAGKPHPPSGWPAPDSERGSQAISADLLEQVSWLRGEMAPYSESGHILLITDVASSDLLELIPDIQRNLHDDAFHSNPLAYAKAIDATRDVVSTSSLPLNSERGLGGEVNSAKLLELETLAAFADALPPLPTDQHLRNPRTAIQKLWKDYLRFGTITPDLERGIEALIEPIRTDLDSYTNSAVTSSDPAFQLTAVKLPEDNDGLIVRGENVTDSDVWVTLTPFRAYPHVEVVTMDEVPTGGVLAPDAESNGAVRLKAGPHRIITLWFHD
jgi:hypothetical protein